MPLHKCAIHPAMLLSLCACSPPGSQPGGCPKASLPPRPAQDRSKEFCPSRMANRMRARAVSLEE